MFCNLVHRSDIILCGANCHIEHCQTIVNDETKYFELVIHEYNTIPFFFLIKTYLRCTFGLHLTPHCQSDLPRNKVLRVTYHNITKYYSTVQNLLTSIK